MAAPHRYAAGFGETAASVYDAGRAPYVPEVVAALGLPPAAPVLDLAAGTGLLSEALIAAGHEVIAVEPMAEMRRRLAARIGADRVREGTAEAIPAADGAVGGVAVGDAFHWFDPDPAAAEIHRVLAPGGTLSLVWRWTHWNGIADAPEWGLEIRRRIAALRGDHPGFTADQGRDGVDRHGGFTEWRHQRVEFSRPIDRAGLRAQLQSISFISMLPDDERMALIDELAVLMPDGVFQEPNVADIWIAKRL